MDGNRPFTGCLWLVLQLAVEALEQEKESLQSQIAQVLEGRQQLAHLKMSLSLEVATYRYGWTRPPRRTRMRAHTHTQHTRARGRDPPPQGAQGHGCW